jgi:ribosomal protein L35
LSHKGRDQKRRLSGTAVVDATVTSSLSRLLPYK